MLTATRAALCDALQFSGHIVERRNTIPILSNVLFFRGEKGLALRMTDLDIELEVAVTAALDAAFRPFTVPAGLLYEIVRKLPQGAECLLEAADPELRQMRLKSGRSRFALQVLPERDFPGMPANDTAGFTLSAKAFAEGLAAVAFAISTEETRYYLNGVYIHPAEGGLMLVATDGHRLARRFLSLEAGAPDMPPVIIPKKTVGVLQKLLPTEGTVELRVNDSRITVLMDGKRLTSKVIDGTFPDYQRVIPAEMPKPAEIESAALKAAVDRVATISTEKGRGMKFTFADGTLTLAVHSPDAGTSEEHLDYEGAFTLETGFNARYVLEAIDKLPTGTLTLAANDAGSPAVLRADGDHRLNLIVLMPMRVGGPQA